MFNDSSTRDTDRPIIPAGMRWSRLVPQPLREPPQPAQPGSGGGVRRRGGTQPGSPAPRPHLQLVIASVGGCKACCIILRRAQRAVEHCSCTTGMRPMLTAHQRAATVLIGRSASQPPLPRASSSSLVWKPRFNLPRSRTSTPARWKKHSSWARSGHQLPGLDCARRPSACQLPARLQPSQPSWHQCCRCRHWCLPSTHAN